MSSIPYVGVLVEVTSYSTARGLVVVTEGYTRIVTYGNLALIRDSEEQDREYLATVVDVREKGTLPSVDHKALEEIYTQVIRGAGVEPRRVAEALREIVFPGVHRQYGLREVDLYILGELVKERGRLRIQPHRRPPRPYSTIEEPDPDTVNRLLAPTCDLMILGRHFVIEEALVALDPRALNTHLAIVGQTGSGKTETVKRIALEYLARTPAPKSLIILDVAGEYLGYPYKPPATGGQTPIPLLDAILEPNKYICEPREECQRILVNQPPSPPQAITVYVPYNIGKVGYRLHDEENYFRRYKGLLDYLSTKLGGHGRSIDTLLFGRYQVYELDPSTGAPRRIDLYTAWQKIRGDGDLLVAAPPPDAMTIDEIIDYSGTRSEYAPLAIAAVADTLGLLHGETVAGVNFVANLLSIYDHLEKTHGSESHPTKFRQLGDRIVDALSEEIEESRRNNRIVNDNVLKNAIENYLGSRRRGGRRVYINKAAWWYFVTLPLWQWWDPGLFSSRDIERPFNPLDPETLEAALNAEDPDYPGRRWRETLPERLEGFADVFGKIHEATRGSVIRAMRKVSFLTSPTLYYEIYRELVSRLLEREFTLVLLAPPSTGAAEFPVARLLQETFNSAVAKYDPSVDRRTLIIAEEAHNLAPAGGDAATKPYMVQIAREGRKWGLGLVIVTQRPGFVDSDVLSQAATLVALRVTNPEDIASLRRSVESATREMVERLPDLDRGQAIVSGMAVPERRVPVVARVEMLGSDKCLARDTQ